MATSAQRSSPRRRERARAPLIRELLAVPGDIGAAKSRAELRLLKIVRDAGLPLPSANVLVAGHQFDLVWREQRLIAEYDSWRYHHTPARFAGDRRKHNAAQAAGFAVFRYTDADLLEPLALAAQLAARLARAA